MASSRACIALDSGPEGLAAQLSNVSFARTWYAALMRPLTGEPRNDSGPRLNGAGSWVSFRTPGASRAPAGAALESSKSAWMALDAPDGASCVSRTPTFGTKGSQVQILSPRPSEGRGIARKTGEATAFVFPAPSASHHRLTKPSDAAYRALVQAALHAIEAGDLGRARRLLVGVLRALGDADDGGRR
jgi:hypothetical protein